MVQVGNGNSLAQYDGRGDGKMWADSRLYDGMNGEGRRSGHHRCSYVSASYNWVDGDVTISNGVDC